MAGTKARNPTPIVVRRWIKDGFGQGEGATYKPFMYVRDVPSIGASNTVNSKVTGRIHHYLSRQEFRLHLLAEYSPSILDIREQFALLPWEETQSIAYQLGIKHPKYPSTTTPIVITTDLLLTMRRPDGIELIALSAKLAKDLDPRALEKLLIERLFWNRRGIRWILVTEKNMPTIRAENLKFFEMAFKDDRADKSGIDPTHFSRQFEANHTQALCFNDILEKTCSNFGIDMSTGHALLGIAVWKRESRINIDATLLDHRAPVVLSHSKEQ